MGNLINSVVKSVVRPVVWPVGNTLTNRRGGGLADGAGQSFNGVDEYAYVANNGALDIKVAVDAGATDFCIGGYITTGSDITTDMYIFGKNVAGNVAGRYGFFIGSGNLLFFFQTSTQAMISDNITLAINTKYHVLARVDITNSKIYFYIDNVLQNTGGTAFTGTFATMENKYEFILGASNTSTGTSVSVFFNGQLQDVRVYHKDVSSSANQIAWMNGEALGDEVAWWNLPTLTGFGGTAYDLTGVNL